MPAEEKQVPVHMLEGKKGGVPAPLLPCVETCKYIGMAYPNKAGDPAEIKVVGFKVEPATPQENIKQESLSVQCNLPPAPPLTPPPTPSPPPSPTPSPMPPPTPPPTPSPTPPSTPPATRRLSTSHSLDVFPVPGRQ
ncbi:hypothetical protein GQ43DRAFT_433052 [Delitschia confertaspora ATCC 74209]|uniref:Uncharacterized protein n=1 Tax=Delitschia confertaspora ATCC 74209 TaxID=1513339 RepID=A0A9P4JMG9_9PLEO|nr:hypothetical protein GQ43DRAFT_433052 [Delitschia confertaspora ATCC 74209]